jgi:hypothetical protein
MSHVYGHSGEELDKDELLRASDQVSPQVARLEMAAEASAAKYGEGGIRAGDRLRISSPHNDPMVDITKLAGLVSGGVKPLSGEFGHLYHRQAELRGDEAWAEMIEECVLGKN